MSTGPDTTRRARDLEQAVAERSERLRAVEELSRLALPVGDPAQMKAESLEGHDFEGIDGLRLLRPEDVG